MVDMNCQFTYSWQSPSPGWRCPCCCQLQQMKQCGLSHWPQPEEDCGGEQHLDLIIIKKLHLLKIKRICDLERAQLRKRGDGAEVVVDVEHGGVQQGVDVLQTLEPGLEAPSAFCLQLPQLLL